MHLVHIYFENAYENRADELCLKRGPDEIAKWTVLAGGHAGREMLRLIAVACGGVGLLPRLAFALESLRCHSDRPLQVEVILAGHPPLEAPYRGAVQWCCGVCIDGKGLGRALDRKECRFLSPDIPKRSSKTGIGDSWLFFLGYGPESKHHDGTDDFDFTDPFFRLTWFHSLFLDQALLTDPVAFLTGIHYRGVKCKRLPPTYVLKRLSRLFKEHLAIDTGSWLEKECDFRQQWAALAPWQHRAVLPAIDAARHLLGAYPKRRRPLDIPGLILFDRPDRSCPEGLFPQWVRLMDLLLPQMQFLITLDDQARLRFPGDIMAATCKLPKPFERPEKRRARAPQGAILLVDVDSTLPNLALMKLSRYFKDQGRRVALVRREAFIAGVEAVYASGVFSRSLTWNRIERLRKYYGDVLIVGGSAVDLKKRLPEEIEKLPADYSLYPELGDRAIGFLTRGCSFSCSFCIVPIKEGQPRQVADLDDLLQDGRRKLILLDDNILAHPGSGDLLEEMAVRDLEINFNQTLDLRLVDQEKVRLLKRIRCSNLRFTRRAIHFSLNDHHNLADVRRKYQMFGFNGKDNVEFICMYGFNTTLAEDVERFRFLRSLPGTYVFVQEYRPILGGPPAIVTDFFDEHADELIDELIRINFRQNMKSMERYYRWVSKRYVQTFGKLHQRLVDTIFRYNKRQGRGLYMATMAHLCSHNTAG